MAKPNPVLTLSTTDYDRPKVDIDGELYEMRSPDEMTVPMLRDFMELGNALAKEDTDLEETAEAIRNGVDLLMVELPAEVRDKLTLKQQGRIISVFTRLAGEQDEPETSQESSSPSPDSNDSSEAA